MTAAVSVALALLSLSVTRGASLGLLVMGTLLWPQSVRYPIWIVQMSVPRTIGLGILLSFLFRGLPSAFRFNRIDALVLAVWLWTVLATLLAGAAFDQTKEMIGRGLDTALIYFAARLCLLTAADVRAALAPIMATIIIASLGAVVEAFTGSSVYQSLAPRQGEMRLGLMRAQFSTDHPIYFGIALTLLTGLLWSLRDFALSPRGRFWVRVGCVFGGLGVFSSLSSGPWLTFAILVFAHSLFYRPQLIKPLLLAGMVMALALELASNRHFYELIDYLGMNSRNAWYRTRLLEVAFSHLDDFALVGAGSEWPDYWGKLIDGRAYVDVVNQFILVALYGGIGALVFYIASHVLVLKEAVRRWTLPRERGTRSLCFGGCATLVALDIGSFSVGLFGSALVLMHVVLGVLVSAVMDHVTSTTRTVYREPVQLFRYL